MEVDLFSLQQIVTAATAELCRVIELMQLDLPIGSTTLTPEQFRELTAFSEAERDDYYRMMCDDST